jgi:hypothetical protein
MGTVLGNAIGIPFSKRSPYWTQQLINTYCLFYASDNTDLLNKVTATHLPNQVTGAVDFLTVTGTGLNARYRTPDSPTYRTADSDYVFWKSDASESTCDGNRLIAYDFPRILVKYGNTSPYTITAIAILKPGAVVTNGMRDAFNLSIWWSNTLSFHGKSKQNRSDAQATWAPEYVSPAIPTGLALSLISNGIKIDWTDNTGGLAQTEIWAKNNSDAYALAYTMAAGVITKSETTTPVDLRYIKLRAKAGSLYSDYTTEQSIAMLGTEKIVNGINFTDSNSDGWADNWGTYWGGGTGSIITDTYVAQKNTVTNDGAYYHGDIRQLLTFSAGKAYMIDFYAKTGVIDMVDIRIGSGGSSMWQQPATAANVWLHFASIYTYNAAYDNNMLRLGHYGDVAGKWIQVAKVSVKEVLMP